MSRQFFLLLKLQLQNELKLDRWKQQNKKQLLRFAALGGLYVLVAAMMLWYCYIMAAGLAAVGLVRLIPLYAITVAGLATIFFTFLKANGVLFGCRDYELLTALPIRTGVVLSSRFAVMYLLNTLFSLGVMAAMGIVYFSYAPGGLSWAFWILGILLASLIPTTVASLAAALVAAVASRFRYSNAVMIVVSLALTFGVLALSMQIGQMGDSMNAVTIAALGDQIAGQLTRLYPPAAWFGRALSEQNMVMFGGFAGISIAFYLIFAVLLSIFYQDIQNGLNAHKSSGNYRIGKLRGRSVLMALYQKEWSGFTSSPVYVLNMGIGALMAVAASAVLCFWGPETLLGIANIPGMENWFSRIFLYIPVVLLPMCNTACVSLSLEGKQVWILKSSPVQPSEVFGAKILVNLTLTLPCALACSLFLGLGIKAELPDVLIMLVLSVAVAFLTAVGGIWINLKFPVYEWESQIQIVKRSASSGCGMLGGLAVGVGLAFLAVKFSELPLWLIGGAESLLVGLLAFLLWGGLQKQKIA